MKATPQAGHSTTLYTSQEDPEELYHSLRAKAMVFLANEDEELARGGYVPNLGAEAAGQRFLVDPSW